MKSKRKRSLPLWMFVTLFLIMFIFFMAWYFKICSKNGIAPSDWAMLALGIVCAVECLACAFIKTRPSNRKALTDIEKSYIETAVMAAAAALGIEAPTMQTVTENEVTDDLRD